MASFASKRAHREARQSKSFINPTEKHVQVEAEANIDVPSIANENVSPGLYSDLPTSLEIRRDDVKGRGIWSERAFKRGSVLLTQRPHVSVLSTPNLSTHCSFCASTSRSEIFLKCCTKCRTIWYCSSRCQNADWPYHKYECSAISKWISASPDGSPPGEAIRSLGRIIWGRRVEGETSSWWKEIQGFQSHRSALPPSAIESYTQLAHGLVRYLGATSPDELVPYGLHSSGDLVDLISRFITNTFTLSSPALSPLGTCVSPVAALFNHSCLPNAVIVFPRSSSTNLQSGPSLQEPLLHVIAIKDLSPGEEVLTAYIDTSLPTSLRQQSLNETYNFTCTCPLCSGTGTDAREVMWCPKFCGGMCPYPFGQEITEALPRCTSCKTALSQSALHDIQDKARIGQEALEKATSEQFSDPVRALNLTSHIIPLLATNFPPSSHPLLAILRLHQSLLITALASSASSMLDDTIRATERAVSGLTAILDEGHPVRGLALAELGKLLAVDEPPPPMSSASQPNPFPPTGPARLKLAVDTLKRTLNELMIGFGESTGGGEVGNEIREDIVKLEREVSVWNRGVRNAWEDMAPQLNNNGKKIG